MSAGKGPGRSRRKFTPEFKAEVVAMVEASGGRIAQVAREMRLHDSSVGNWVREAREAKAGNGPTAAERAEIRELKAELERVSRERDILGKAVAYFSASHPKNV
jgi:transposase